MGPVDQWKLIGEWQYTGEMIASRDGNVVLPARHVVNLTAAVDLATIRPLQVHRMKFPKKSLPALLPERASGAPQQHQLP